jgi:hypothetical protein
MRFKLQGSTIGQREAKCKSFIKPSFSVGCMDRIRLMTGVLARTPFVGSFHHVVSLHPTPGCWQVTLCSQEGTQPLKVNRECEINDHYSSTYLLEVGDSEVRLNAHFGFIYYNLACPGKGENDTWPEIFPGLDIINYIYVKRGTGREGAFHDHLGFEKCVLRACTSVSGSRSLPGSSRSLKLTRCRPATWNTREEMRISSFRKAIMTQ